MIASKDDRNFNIPTLTIPQKQTEQTNSRFYNPQRRIRQIAMQPSPPPEQIRPFNPP
jgi:hypothetical protein